MNTDFETWWSQVQPGILDIARAYCTADGRAFDGEDLVQELAVIAYLHHQDLPFESPGQLASWTRRRIHWLCLDKLKTLHPRLLEEYSAREERVEDAPQRDETVRQDLMRALWELLAELPTEQQAVIRLRLKGGSDEEIARELGKSLENVRSTRRHAQNELIKKLAALDP